LTDTPSRYCFSRLLKNMFSFSSVAFYFSIASLSSKTLLNLL
jgi:hypothetical protein